MFAIPLIVRNAESTSTQQGRRIMIALLILLLIALPLYLWPRGGLGGLGAAGLPGSVLDPRSPGAVARIPAEVWDALMGRAEAPPRLQPGQVTRNLTMISQLEELSDHGLDLSVDRASSLAREMIATLPSSSDPPDEKSGGDGATPSFASNPLGIPGTGPGPASYLRFGDLGPWTGGGPGGGPSFQISGPTVDVGAPAPTPEPATLVLLGSNLALLGAAAWKRRRRRREPPPIG